MALHLSGILKDQKWSLGAHFLSKPVFERKRGKMGRKARAHDESYWTFVGLVQKMSTQQLVVSLVEFPWKARWQLVVLELLQEMSYSH